MNNINFKTKLDIETDIDRITQILNYDIFLKQNSQHPLKQSAFIELMIRLNDLLFQCNKYGHRINFNNNIVYQRYRNYRNEEKEVRDITDAVGYMRNAACHIESELNQLDQNITFTFNIAYGKCNLITTPNKYITSDYEDDICFFYGEQKLYLKRHIIRAFEESKIILGQLTPAV